MADWLRARLPQSVVCASPAQRTQQTAAAWGAPFLTETALSPDALAQDIITWLQVTLTQAPLILVGHQPTLGQVAAGLMTGQHAPWAVKRGAIWWLRQGEPESGGAQWTLRAVLAPSDLA
jgi:phosphohistidine phosphatase